MITHKPTADYQWIDNVTSCAAVGTYSAQIISGIILIWSVFKVRAFMLKRKINGQALNVKSMCLHASAFSIFAVSVLAFTVIYAKYLLDINNNKEDYKLLVISITIMFILSFFSQCLLCVIFWQLGKT